MQISGCSAENSSKNWPSFKVASSKTSMPCSDATVLTGDGVSVCLRPCGLSGAVTTVCGAKSLCSNACNAGTAKSGVPKNIVFTGIDIERCLS